ncbi:MAG: DUF1015 domain-containing protein, partial [Candidatus Margulisiibacteriota bacterium]
MVNVFPFKGITYNKKKLKNLSKVMSPPYDVISPEEHEALYELSDYNIVRLILGREFPGDSQYNNRYVRAAAFFEGWLRHDILCQDEKPAIYIYEQVFRVGSKEYKRSGFISLLRLEEIGKGDVFPHEHTLSKPKYDRVELIKTTNANFDCVFSLFSDNNNKVQRLLKQYMRRKPTIEVKDKYKVANRLWRVDKKDFINKIVREMKEKEVFIADGHHRYEAALRYKKEMKDRNTRFTEDEAYNNVMMFFAPVECPGLVVFPIHRLITRIHEFDADRFLEDIKAYFDVEKFAFTKRSEVSQRSKVVKLCAKRGESEHCFVLYLHGTSEYYLLTLRNKGIMSELVEENKPQEWKTLDVTILQTLILKHILNITSEDSVKYTKDDEDAVSKVKNGEFQMCFILNPTKIEEVITIAQKMEKMPQKSTFFY